MKGRVAMRDVRCAIGRHAWSTDGPETTHAPIGAVTLTCRRCGRQKSQANVTDTNGGFPPGFVG